MPIKSSVGGAGTDAPPLQKPGFPENETALGGRGDQRYVANINKMDISY